MKKLSLIYFVLTLLSCNTNSPRQNPEGVYTCTFEHEFAKTEDTLLLQRTNKNFFKIIRHSGVASKKDNKKKMISEVWKLEYDEDINVFTDIKRGRKFFWNSDEEQLVFGNRNYVKLKN